MNDTAAAILKATAALRDGTERLRFGAPVHVTYNPLAYAWNPHEQYVRTYGNGEKGHLFLGMHTASTAARCSAGSLSGVMLAPVAPIQISGQ